MQDNPSADTRITLNKEAYAHIFQVEVVLRELITESLRNSVGQNWLKTRCPPEVKEKYQSALAVAKSKMIWRNMPLTPLYFCDYPHLRIIIERADNWRDVFSKILDKKFIELLSASESIRNSVAHGRYINHPEAQLLSALWGHLSQLLGETVTMEYLSKSLLTEDIENTICALINEVKEAKAVVQTGEKIEGGDLSLIAKINFYPWLDGDILTSDLAPIRSIAKALRDYNSLDRVPGYYYRIEKVVRDTSLVELLDNGCIALESVKREINDKSL